MANSAAQAPATASTSKPKAKNLKLDSLNISPTENGGYVVRCTKKPAETSKGEVGYYSPDEYAFGDKPQLVEFLNKELGLGIKLEKAAK